MTSRAEVVAELAQWHRKAAWTGVAVDETTPAAFLSYAHHDDEHDGGNITAFRKALQGEVRSQTGRPDVRIFQDRDDIAWGDAWKERIDRSLDAVTFLVPVLTPSFLASTHCRSELRRFLEREQRLGRRDLILPVYWIETPVLENEARQKADNLARELAARQYADWRELRFQQVGDKDARRALAALAKRIRDALDPADQAERSLEAIRSHVVDVIDRAVTEVRGGNADVVGLVNVLVDTVRDASWLPEEMVLALRWTSQSRVDSPPSAMRESTSAPLDMPPGAEPTNADSFQSGALAIVIKTVTSMVTAKGDSAVADRLVDTIRNIFTLGDSVPAEHTRALVDPLRGAARLHLEVVHAAAERAERAREAAERAAREAAEHAAEQAAATQAEAIRVAHEERDDAIRQLQDAIVRQTDLKRRLDESVATSRRLADVERELDRVRRTADELEAESERRLRESTTATQRLAEVENELTRVRRAADERETENARLTVAWNSERDQIQQLVAFLQHMLASIHESPVTPPPDHTDHSDNDVHEPQPPEPEKNPSPSSPAEPPTEVKAARTTVGAARPARVDESTVGSPVSARRPENKIAVVADVVRRAGRGGGRQTAATTAETEMVLPTLRSEYRPTRQRRTRRDSPRPAIIRNTFQELTRRLIRSKPRRERWPEKDEARPPYLRRVLFVSLPALILVISGVGGTWAWVNSQYYVGIDGDRVAVFRGVAGDPVLGFGHTLVHRSDRKLTDFADDQHAKLRDGVDVSSQEEGLVYIRRLPLDPSEKENIFPPGWRPTLAPLRNLPPGSF